MTNNNHQQPMWTNELVATRIDSLAGNTQRSYWGALQRLARYGISGPGDLTDETLSGAIRSMTGGRYTAGTISVTIAAARWAARRCAGVGRLTGLLISIRDGSTAWTRRTRRVDLFPPARTLLRRSCR